MFLQHKISGKQICAEPQKDKKSNTSFSKNWMVVYLSKFIPQLSEQTHKLRKPIKNSTWDSNVTDRN